MGEIDVEVSEILNMDGQEVIWILIIQRQNLAYSTIYSILPRANLIWNKVAGK